MDYSGTRLFILGSHFFEKGNCALSVCAFLFAQGLRCRSQTQFCGTEGRIWSVVENHVEHHRESTRASSTGSVTTATQEGITSHRYISHVAKSLGIQIKTVKDEVFSLCSSVKLMKSIPVSLDPEGWPVQKPFEILSDSALGATREWKVIAKLCTFRFSFSFFYQFLLSSSGPKPQRSNNGDECVIISDSDEDEEKSQNLGQEDEDDDQVGGEVFLFTIMSW